MSRKVHGQRAKDKRRETGKGLPEDQSGPLKVTSLYCTFREKLEPFENLAPV